MTLIINDVREACEPHWFAYQSLSLATIQYIFVHRNSMAHFDKEQNPHPIADPLLTGPELAKRFRATAALKTGKRVPYHLLVRDDGQVDQMLSLTRRGSHAAKKNWCSWAVAIAGNADEREISPRQWSVLVDLLRLLRELRPEAAIVGHTEIPGASGDPTKHCPGRYLSMDALRAAVGRYVGHVDPTIAIASAVNAVLIMR